MGKGKRGLMKPVSLRTKLSLTYILVALLCVILTGIITNLLLDRHFKEYIINKQQEKSAELLAQLSRLFSPEKGWDTEAMESICVYALSQGLIIRVEDPSGKIIWDARRHDNDECERMLHHLEDNMNSRYPNWQGGYVENIFPVKNGSVDAGTVFIGYYGPYFYNDGDLAFINNINRLLLAVAALALALSLLLGYVMAQRISTPLSRVADTAASISRGRYDSRINEYPATKEMARLTETINHLAESLEKQEILRKRLTADVAHELRTPLATLQSHMEAMMDGIWEPTHERLKSCHDEILRLSRLVGDLEKLSLYESEALPLNLTVFDLSELIRHVIRIFEKDFSSKGIEISFVGDLEEPKEADKEAHKEADLMRVMVRADRDKIGQVLVNLLSNALKYTEEGGRVDLAVEESGDSVRIVVRDTGIGIPEEDLPYIFERFYRADKSRNRLTGGAGIGLAITKAIVDAHKGSIEVKSRPGQGTEVTVLLPRGEIG